MKQSTKKDSKTGTGIEEQVHKYHSQNPFMEQLAMTIEMKPVRKVIGSKYQQVVNEGTGELSNQKLLVLGEKKMVDRQEFYKMFMGEIKRFFELSPSTMKLFDYLMKEIQYNKDRICLYKPDVMDKLSISRTSCHRGIQELLDAQIIAKADTDNCYFVNPTVAFKGDRIALWKEYQVRDKEADPYAGMPDISIYVQEPESEYSKGTGINEETNETI